MFSTVKHKGDELHIDDDKGGSDVDRYNNIKKNMCVCTSRTHLNLKRGYAHLL